MSVSAGSLEYDARIDTKKIKDDAKSVDNTVKDLADSGDNHMGRFSDSIKKAGVVLATTAAAAGAAIIGFGISSVKSAIASENEMAQLNAVLSSTGGVAGVTADQVTKLASALQKSTRYSDEQITSAESMLLTFTNIHKDVFPQTTKAVADMATAMKQDLQTTAIQVGKALQDPVQGVTALQRVGVRLTDSQKDLVQQMVAVGDTAGAQNLILKELQTEFGGSAEAAGKTFAGSLERVKNQIDDVKEAMGTAIIKGISPLITKIAEFVSAVDWESVINRSITAIKNIWDELSKFGKAVGDVASQVADYLMPKIQALWTDIKDNVIPTLLRLWHEVIEPLAPIVGTVLVGALGLAIDAFKFLLDIVTPVINFMLDNKLTVLAFAGAFGILMAALNFDAAFNALTVGFNTFKLVTIPSTIASMEALQAVVAAPMVMGAIAIGAALIALAAVYDAAMKTKDAINSEMSAIESAKKSQADVHASLQAGLLSGDPKVRDRSQRAINSGLATGTDNWRGGPTWVGEKGPEIVNLPRGSQVIPNNQLDSMMGGTQIEYHIGTITISTEADGERWLKKLTRNQEIMSKGLTPGIAL